MPSHAPNGGREHGVFDRLRNLFSSPPSPTTTGSDPSPPAASAAVPRPASTDSPRPSVDALHPRTAAEVALPRPLPRQQRAPFQPRRRSPQSRCSPISSRPPSVTAEATPYAVPACVPVMAAGAGINAADPLHLLAGNVFRQLPGRESLTRGRSPVRDISQPPPLERDCSESSIRSFGPRMCCVPSTAAIEGPAHLFEENSFRAASHGEGDRRRTLDSDHGPPGGGSDGGRVPWERRILPVSPCSS